MKKNLLSCLCVFILTSFGFSFSAKAQLTISTVRTFSSLDGSSDDADGTVNGVFTVTGNLIIANGGSITNNDAGVPNNGAGAITISVSGNMEIQAGGSIYAENQTAAGNGGDITITVGGTYTMRATSGATNGGFISSSNLSATSGNMNAGTITIHVTSIVSMEAGSIVKANSYKGKGGDIEITSSNNITVDGSVLSQSTGTGTGTNQGHGGMITIKGTGTLLINDNAILSSHGADPGADLVHLESCIVNVYGFVQSSGIGHGIPSNPPNHLSGTNRPDKPSNSTGGVEVWANIIIVDNLSHNGEIEANTGGGGGSSGTSWIDLLARNTITITGKTSGSVFAVCANGNAGTNDDGGFITVKSLTEKVMISGQGLQASATNSGGAGGSVTVHSKLDMDLSSGKLEAKGATSGGAPHGGTIALRSFGTTPTGSIVTNSSTNLNVTGGISPDGSVSLITCSGSTGFPAGTITPSSISPSTSTACGGDPSMESYVTLPAQNCGSSELRSLPVKMASFTAQLNNNVVILKWTTITEINVSHFVIEKSDDGKNFNDAGLVFAYGNSSQKIDYNFSDNISASQTSVLYYRLRSVDIDGKFEYSAIRIIRLNNKQTDAINILTYPNPVSNELRITIPNNWQGKNVAYEIFNGSGQITAKTVSVSSSQTETINVSNFARGLYIVRASCGGETAQQKIIKN